MKIKIKFKRLIAAVLLSFIVIILALAIICYGGWYNSVSNCSLGANMGVSGTTTCNPINISFMDFSGIFLKILYEMFALWQFWTSVFLIGILFSVWNNAFYRGKNEN